MAIDASIYNNLQAPDFLGAVNQGLRMADLIQQRKAAQKKAQDQATMADLVKGSVVTNPDGTTVFDQKGLAGKFADAGFYDQAAQAYQANQAQENKMRDYDLEQQRLQSAAADRKESRDERRALFGLQMSDRRDARDAAAQERAERLAEKKAQGSFLPLDQKQMVSGLAQKNANKIAIANQIDSVLSGWDALPDNQKVAAGRQLIKTLNSTEGADAVGAEEAKRLGGMLEFAMGNFTNSNPMQFGRDLPGFREQAANTAKNIRGAVSSNQAQIDQLMGRQAPAVADQRGDAIAWALANPSDPRSMAVLKKAGYAVGAK
jgi:hypothetical protein